MALLAESILRTPMAGNEQRYVWNRAVKLFEDNNIVALEAAINAFIVTLKNTQEYAAVLGIDIAPGAGANLRVLISYGYFTPP